VKGYSIDISIIIVSWNTVALLKECLSSVLKSLQNIEKGELIVVDNNSSDNSVFLLEQEFPQARLIKNDSNLGFSKANNQGIVACKGRYLLLLNSDTIVNDNLLPNLIEFMDEHPDAGACGVRLIRPDGTTQPFGFGNDPTLGYLIERVLTSYILHKPLHNWSPDKVIESDWVSGACLMLRSEVIHHTGPLDENIFMYFEDNDLCLRIRKAGWKVYYNPHISVMHLGGQSLIKNTEARTYYNKSLLYFYKKHYGIVQHLILKILFVLYKFIVRYSRENCH
jgi:N-acetylglucosaminyl-diphospho-decaprenol L-rhamnosyltransferase